jgi:hypothetical protein
LSLSSASEGRVDSQLANLHRGHRVFGSFLCSARVLLEDREVMVNNLRMVCVQIVNGEKHYIVQSFQGNENPDKSIDLDEAEVRRTMKKEAAKPLLLLRAE